MNTLAFHNRQNTADASPGHSHVSLSDAEARQWALAGLVGTSPGFVRLIHLLRSLEANPKTNVLITGETGTGKDLLARAIHFGGPLASGPFVPLNCAALTADQADATFFGQARSNHVGAASERKGVFETAHGGTLYLDEVGDMPLSVQSRLLRVLDDGIIQPLGASAPRTVRVRVIAATHVDLPAKVAAGGFRQDLYYRLMQFHLPVPPLRDRMEDVPVLAQHFARALSVDLKRTPPFIGTDAFQRLLTHRYPGNIRELKNTIERALIAADGADLNARHIVFTQPAGPGFAPAAPAREDGASATSGSALDELPLNLAEAEDRLIARAISVAGGNLSMAARLLGINRASLYRWQTRQGNASASPVSIGEK